MKQCDKCKVQILGGNKYCPLCQALLTGTDCEEEEVFPRIPTIYYQHNLFFRLLILVSIAASISCIAVNLLIPQYGWWSLFVVAGILCMWLSLAMAVRKRNNIPKSMLYQVVIISILAILWDYFTKWHGWSIDYVIPIICLSAMIALAITTRILHLKISDLLIYFCIAALFGIVPVIFLLTNSLGVLYPSLICVAGSILSVSTLLLFEGKDLKNELKRRLHL